MIPEKLYHATYKQFLKSIQQKGLGNTKRKMWTDSVRGVVYLADDPWVAESYAEESEWVDERDDPDAYLENIIILEIDTTKLDESKFEVDKNVILEPDEENSTWEYHGIIPWEACTIFNTELQEWKLTNNNSLATKEDFTENFKKLVNHLKTIFSCSVEELESQELIAHLAFSYNKQILHIKYLSDRKCFIVNIKDEISKQILLDTTWYNGWDEVLTNLLVQGYIKDKKLCETLSTIDEFELYKNLWD